MLYDCHSHIDFINENEVKPLLEDSLKEGVGEIISCATSFYSNEKTLTLSKQHPQIKPAQGLYPLNALERNEEELNKASTITPFFSITEIKSEQESFKSTAFQESKLIKER